ncbi:MAG: YraN family protein [Alphaproteobacteria bacterium]
MAYQKKIQSFKRGLWAEYFVMILYWLKGHNILKHRFKCRFGEIDIITKRRQQIYFLEIKTRNSKKNFEEIISDSQIARIIDSGEYFLQKNPNFKNCKINYNLLFLTPIFFPFFKIKYCKNINS